MKVLVCGGRDFQDYGHLCRVLDFMHGCIPVREIIHGCARGADTLAGEWAEANRILVEKYPALWEEHGRAAGHIRNALMLSEGQPDMVMAFPGGRGTADMVRRAKQAGVPVVEL